MCVEAMTGSNDRHMAVQDEAAIPLDKELLRHFI
jgi:hypothetical protein